MEKLIGTVTIKKGWYRTAGRTYGWELSGLLPEGVGINRETLYSYDELIITVNGEKYRLDTTEAIEFIRKHGSHETMTGGTRIGIVSRSLLKKEV